VLQSRVLLESPVATVAAVRCAAVGHGWSPEEQVARSAVVLVRRGVFRRRADGRVALADATTGYLQRPGECQQIAHPAGGDVCTSIGVGDELAERFAAGGVITVPPAADLAHRLLLAAPPPDRAGHAAELIAALLPGEIHCSRSVDDVRELLHTEPGRDLTALAAAVGWSPWHLSRVFHRATGIRLTAYRHRLRVRAALDDLAEEPGTGLAGLAARHGFADQAHMTRSIRAETGGTPAALRRRLSRTTPGLDM
jgi:AraC-like DNA-binding protein